MDYEKPMHFLSELKKYVSVTKTSDEDLPAVFQQCLDKRASQWFYTVEHKIKDVEDFEIHFKERFWNEPIKSALRIRLEAGSYVPSTKKSQIQYAEDMIAEMKELEMNLAEVDMIKKISRHFGPDNSRVVRIQSISQLGQLYDLLQEFDNVDHPKKQFQRKESFSRNVEGANQQKTPESSQTNHERMNQSVEKEPQHTSAYKNNSFKKVFEPNQRNSYQKKAFENTKNINNIQMKQKKRQNMSSTDLRQQENQEKIQEQEND